MEHPRETSRFKVGRDRRRGKAAAEEDPPRGPDDRAFNRSRGWTFGASRRDLHEVTAASGGEIEGINRRPRMTVRKLWEDFVSLFLLRGFSLLRRSLDATFKLVFVFRFGQRFASGFSSWVARFRLS